VSHFTTFQEKERYQRVTKVDSIRERKTEIVPKKSPLDEVIRQQDPGGEKFECPILEEEEDIDIAKSTCVIECINRRRNGQINFQFAALLGEWRLSQRPKSDMQICRMQDKKKSNTFKLFRDDTEMS